MKTHLKALRALNKSLYTLPLCSIVLVLANRSVKKSLFGMSLVLAEMLFLLIWQTLTSFKGGFGIFWVVLVLRHKTPINLLQKMGSFFFMLRRFLHR